MAVRTKGRRKIMVDGNRYIWYVALDYDSPYYLLHISSEDKSFIITHPLNMNSPYIISKGLVFQGKKTNGRWGRYLLPFPVPEVITPKDVSEIIRFATQGKGGEEVIWDGREIPV